MNRIGLALGDRHDIIRATQQRELAAEEAHAALAEQLAREARLELVQELTPSGGGSVESPDEIDVSQIGTKAAQFALMQGLILDNDAMQPRVIQACDRVNECRRYGDGSPQLEAARRDREAAYNAVTATLMIREALSDSLQQRLLPPVEMEESQRAACRLRDSPSALDSWEDSAWVSKTEDGVHEDTLQQLAELHTMAWLSHRESVKRAGQLRAVLEKT